MKNIFSSFLIFSLVFSGFVFPVNKTEAAPVTIFSEDFGTGGNNTNLPSGWSERW